MASTKGNSVVDSINGNLYIETGNTDSNVTRIGKKNNSFVPYSFQIDGYMFLSVYSFTNYDLPSLYDSSVDFIDDLESQHYDNDYIDNYIRMGTNAIREFLKNRNIYDNISFIYIDSNNSIGEKFYSLLTMDKDESLADIIEVKDDDEIKFENLEVVENTPSDVKQHLISQLEVLKRADRSYELEDSAIDNDDLRYLTGFININEEKISNLKNKTCVLVSDYTLSKASIFDAIRELEKRKFKILFNLSLINTK